MGAAMAIPMVAWMRRRGHPWRDGAEMTAAMLVPTFALVVPVALGLPVPWRSHGALMMATHLAMVGGMVLLMLVRWDRYAGDGHCRATDRR